MVQKFKPVIRSNIYGAWSDEPEARLEHSPHGEWVMLKTYTDATAQLIAQRPNQTIRKRIERSWEFCVII